ncbi:tRNA epoxyqueuosine(34) reductase QueG [Pandoraea sp.]|uniref:tRNA epoxyqueuosine(34) reductase QueG n=1 Tax=Pandoraea sp. TaxID=1883445 RepID=UPI0025E1DCEF|nr:tRNA epoxyqueuosine(34) reductase QueG [Pandoraea sp.]
MNGSQTLTSAHASDPHEPGPPDGPEGLARLSARIKQWGRELGFGAIGVSDVDLRAAEAGLLSWLAQGCQGDMDYMANHGLKRARPAELVPGTVRVISARMDYLPAPEAAAAARDWRHVELARQEEPAAAVVSIYARGRDYHKIMRQRLQQLADRVATEIGPFGYRVFTDSAPVLEVELAQKAGLGWRGKHTLLLSRSAGSMFFLGEIYVDLPLPIDRADEDGAHCGHCERCRQACPTGAIVAPYRVDARRCISYLTIEHKGAIPLELRPLLGNRVYGCDDCQLVCPWNKFAQRSPMPDFAVRNGLDDVMLATLFAWSEAEFLERMAGSAIRRIGHERWLRNIAVALGNGLRATGQDALRQALRARANDPSALVREHVAWALAQDPVAMPP